jgi:hypothetical protein
MALKGSTTAIASAPRTALRTIRAFTPALYEILALLAPGLLAFGLTLAYYGLAYRTSVFADDRIRNLFVGFQSLEGGSEPYRWSKGAGQVCLPATGPGRPASGLELRLLGSSFTAAAANRAIDQATLRIGGEVLPLRIAPDNRTYRLLVPPGPEAGPVCLTIESATVTPPGTDRVAGVGLRSATLWKLAPGGAPPPAQLLVNLWLAAGGYLLLRTLGLPLRVVLPICTLLTLALGAALVSGKLRVAPDLPYWSAFAAGALALLLPGTALYRWSAPRLRLWQRELLGVSLMGLLLSIGWAVLANLPGYFWPYPLMARGGTEFGWGVLPAVGLLAGYIVLTVSWLRAERPPPASLVIGSAWLAAIVLPASLKVGLRGWDALYQNFALQEGSYIRDVPRIGADPLGFLQTYVAQMPELVLHNKTHPPGSTLFLWLVERLAGPGPGPASWAVIALVGLGAWPTYRLAAALYSQRVATLAAAIYVLLPAFMIYAAVAMDALYAVLLAWAVWCLYAAFVVYEPTTDEGRTATLPLSSVVRRRSFIRQIVAAGAAGAWLAGGLLFSFTTLMLVFVVLALVVHRLVSGPRTLADALRWLALGGIMGGTTLFVLGLVWAITGYDSVAAFFSGIANNRVDVLERVSPLGLSSYLFFLAVNAVAWGWFLGPWALYRLCVAGREAIAATAQGTGRAAAAVSFGMSALILGMLFSGLFYREIERIWLFSHVLVAPALAANLLGGASQRQRWILAGFFLAALALQSIIFRATLRVAW